MSLNNDDLPPVPGKTLGELAAEAAGEPSVAPVEPLAEAADEAEVSVDLELETEDDGDVIESPEAEDFDDDYGDDSDEGPEIDVDGIAPAPGRGIRLQRYLAACGLGSRRECEQLITDGRISIDGETATVLGTRVDPQTQQVQFDGEPLKMERKKYYLLNKPSHYICTSSDPQGRPRVIDLFPNFGPRLFTVGRLDENTTGLLLVTNDGDLAQKLAHPKYRIYRYYKVQVAGQPDREVFDQLREGLYFTEGKFRVHAIKPIRKVGQSTWLEVTMTEGQNREIRRLFARVGHKVMKLERIGYGPLRIGRLLPGQFRELTRNELAELHSILQRNMDSDGQQDLMADDDGFDNAPRDRQSGGRKASGRFDSDRGSRPQGRQRASRFDDEGSDDRPRRPGRRFERSEGGSDDRGDRPRRPRGEGRSEGNYEDRPRRPKGAGGRFGGEGRSEGNYEDRPRRPKGGGRRFSSESRGEGNYEDRPRRPKGAGGRFSGERRSEGSYEDRPRRPKGAGGRFSGEGRSEGSYEDRPRRPKGAGGRFSGEGRSEGSYEDRPRRPKGGGRRFSGGESRGEGGYEDRPRRPKPPGGRFERSERGGEDYSDRPRRPKGPGRFSGEGRGEGSYEDRPRRPKGGGGRFSGEGRGAGSREDRPRRPKGAGGRFSGESRGEGGYEDRPRRPKGSGRRFSGEGRSEGGDRPQRPFKGKRPGGPRSDRPKGKRPRRDD